MIASHAFHRTYNEIRLLLQAGMLEAANHALPELIEYAVTRGQIAMASALEDFIIQKLDEPDEPESEKKLKTLKDYSDELLVNRWKEERELLLDLGDILSDFVGSEKRRQEREEDHTRHSQYIKEIRDEMAARGMFADDGSLKPEYRNLIL